MFGRFNPFWTQIASAVSERVPCSAKTLPNRPKRLGHGLAWAWPGQDPGSACFKPRLGPTCKQWVGLRVWCARWLDKGQCSVLAGQKPTKTGQNSPKPLKTGENLAKPSQNGWPMVGLGLSEVGGFCPTGKLFRFVRACDAKLCVPARRCGCRWLGSEPGIVVRGAAGVRGFCLGLARFVSPGGPPISV